MKRHRVTVYLVNGEVLELETVAPMGIAPFNGYLGWIDVTGKHWAFNWEQVIRYTARVISE